jgi:hypothetical protein
MMREVVVHRDAAHVPRKLHAPPHSLERERASSATAGSTPAWRAAPMAASAFIWL